MNCLKKYNGIVVHARLYSLKFCKIILFFIIFITILYLCMGTIFYKNISPSAPRGIYMIAPNQNLDYGDFVVVKLPVDVPILNVQKGYPMIKKVQGLPGDVYRVGEDAVEIHGRKYKIYHMNGLPQNNKINLLGAIIILALFWFGFLNAGSLFGLQYLMMGSIVIGCLAIMRRSWAHIDLSLTRDQRLSYTREFSDYSMPLFVQALLSALALSAERWVLQWFDGSTQQGYFALSQRVSAACFLFVSAMTPLIMRELAIAWGKDDREHMGHLLTRFAPLLFGIAAWFSCFTAVEASVLVHIFGGAEFAAALVPVQIMALYPAHQAYGQLASSVFHATGKTKVLRNLAFIEHFGGFLLVWLLVAPQDMLGMGLGATGLALKTVTTQFIMVNLLFWMASRLIPLNFFRNLMLQGLILGSLLGIAWVCKQATGIYFADDAHQVIRFFLSGILYSFMSFGLVVTCPWLFGCSWQDFREMLIRLRLIKRKA